MSCMCVEGQILYFIFDLCFFLLGLKKEKYIITKLFMHPK